MIPGPGVPGRAVTRLARGLPPRRRADHAWPRHGTGPGRVVTATSLGRPRVRVRAGSLTAPAVLGGQVAASAVVPGGPSGAALGEFAGPQPACAPDERTQHIYAREGLVAEAWLLIRHCLDNPAITAAGRTLSQGDRNLRTLADALSDAGVPFGTTREDVGYLANARNMAAHEGSEMTADVLRPCLTTLTALLRENGTRLA
jgi:hypothetical protein